LVGHSFSVAQRNRAPRKESAKARWFLIGFDARNCSVDCGSVSEQSRSMKGRLRGVRGLSIERGACLIAGKRGSLGILEQWRKKGRTCLYKQIRP
jgi:hypothetical protein